MKETRPERRNNIIDFAVEKTKRGIYDDDETLRNHWEKRRIRRLIIDADGTSIPSYDEILELSRGGHLFDMDELKFNRELISGGPLRIRLDDGSLIKCECELGQPINITVVPAAEKDLYDLA